MKRENFERAVALNDRVKRLQAIDKLLINSASGRHTLAAIDTDCYGKVEVINQESLPMDILNKFRRVLAEEVLELDKEFETL